MIGYTRNTVTMDYNVSDVRCHETLDDGRINLETEDKIRDKSKRNKRVSSFSIGTHRRKRNEPARSSSKVEDVGNPYTTDVRKLSCDWSTVATSPSWISVSELDKGRGGGNMYNVNNWNHQVQNNSFISSDLNNSNSVSLGDESFVSQGHNNSVVDRSNSYMRNSYRVRQDGGVMYGQQRYSQSVQPASDGRGWYRGANSVISTDETLSPNTSRKYFEEAASRRQSATSRGQTDRNSEIYNRTSVNAVTPNSAYVSSDSVNVYGMVAGTPSNASYIGSENIYSDSSGSPSVPPPLPDTSPPHGPPRGLLNTSSPSDSYTESYTDCRRDSMDHYRQNSLGQCAVRSLYNLSGLGTDNSKADESTHSYTAGAVRYQSGDTRGSPTRYRTPEGRTVLETLNEYPGNQMSMMRKLSQELYGAQKGSSRTSMSRNVSYGATGLPDQVSESPGGPHTSVSDVRGGPPNVSTNDPHRSVGDVRSANSLSSHTGVAVNNSFIDVDEEELEGGSRGFVRHHKPQMSLRKAFGICEVYDVLEEEERRRRGGRLTQTGSEARQPYSNHHMQTSYSNISNQSDVSGSKSSTDSDQTLSEHPRRMRLSKTSEELGQVSDFCGVTARSKSSASLPQHARPVYEHMAGGGHRRSTAQHSASWSFSSDSASSASGHSGSASGNKVGATRRSVEGSGIGVSADRHVAGDVVETSASPPPPVLPPRRYRSESGGDGGLKVADDVNYDVDTTLKPDTYADQLRKQSRRLSSSSRLGGSARGQQGKPPIAKPRPELNTSQSVHHGVDFGAGSRAEINHPVARPRGELNPPIAKPRGDFNPVNSGVDYGVWNSAYEPSDTVSQSVAEVNQVSRSKEVIEPRGADGRCTDRIETWAMSGGVEQVEMSSGPVAASRDHSVSDEFSSAMRGDVSNIRATHDYSYPAHEVLKSDRMSHERNVRYHPPIPHHGDVGYQFSYLSASTDLSVSGLRENLCSTESSRLELNQTNHNPPVFHNQQSYKSSVRDSEQFKSSKHRKSLGDANVRNPAVEKSRRRSQSGDKPAVEMSAVSSEEKADVISESISVRENKDVGDVKPDTTVVSGRSRLSVKLASPRGYVSGEPVVGPVTRPTRSVSSVQTTSVAHVLSPASASVVERKLSPSLHLNRADTTVKASSPDIVRGEEQQETSQTVFIDSRESLTSPDQDVYSPSTDAAGQEWVGKPESSRRRVRSKSNSKPCNSVSPAVQEDSLDVWRVASKPKTAKKPDIKKKSKHGDQVHQIEESSEHQRTITDSLQEEQAHTALASSGHSSETGTALRTRDRPSARRVDTAIVAPCVRRAEPASDVQSSPLRPVAHDKNVSGVYRVRARFVEETAYERLAAVLAGQLGDEDQQLRNLILPPTGYRASVDYLREVLEVVGAERATKSLNTGVDSANSVEHNKMELLSHAEKKLERLKQEKLEVEKEISDNNSRGKQISADIEKRLERKELNKYNTYMTDLDRVTRLLLKLCERLSKADNTLLTLPSCTPDEIKKDLMVKREGLLEKHTEAIQLRESIEQRGDQVLVFLHTALSAPELTRYQSFIEARTCLSIKQQEIFDAVSLADEQISAINNHLQSTTSSSS